MIAIALGLVFGLVAVGHAQELSGYECSCDTAPGLCSPFCCCDPDCTDLERSFFGDMCFSIINSSTAVIRCADMDKMPVQAYSHVAKRGPPSNLFCVSVDNSPISDAFYPTRPFSFSVANAISAANGVSAIEVTATPPAFLSSNISLVVQREGQPFTAPLTVPVGAPGQSGVGACGLASVRMMRGFTSVCAPATCVRASAFEGIRVLTHSDSLAAASAAHAAALEATAAAAAAATQPPVPTDGATPEPAGGSGTGTAARTAVAAQGGSTGTSFGVPLRVHYQTAAVAGGLAVGSVMPEVGSEGSVAPAGGCVVGVSYTFVYERSNLATLSAPRLVAAAAAVVVDNTTSAAAPPAAVFTGVVFARAATETTPSTITQPAPLGPAGYKVGAPLLAAAVTTVNGSRTLSKLQSGLTLPTGSACSPSALAGGGVKPHTVRYGVDTRAAGCRVAAPPITKLRELCASDDPSALPRTVRWILDTNDASGAVRKAVTLGSVSHVGIIATSDVASEAQWVGLLATPPARAPRYDPASGVCYDAVVGIDIIFLTAPLGPHGAPHASVVGAVRRWRLGTIASAEALSRASTTAFGGGFAGMGESAETPTRRPLTPATFFFESSVRFAVGTERDASIHVSVPPLLRALPGDLWFPFAADVPLGESVGLAADTDAGPATDLLA